MVVLCFGLVSDIGVCCYSQRVWLFCVLTWLVMLLFVIAHKVWDCFCLGLVSGVVDWCCSQMV